MGNHYSCCRSDFLLGYQIRNIGINSDILSTLPDHDMTGHLYKSIGAQYGGNDIGMIVLETDDIFTADALQHIRQITDSLKITTGVSTVTSLTDILDIKSSEWGIEIGKLVDVYNLPKEKSELDSLRDYVFSKEMYRGSIVSTMEALLSYYSPSFRVRKTGDCIRYPGKNRRNEPARDRILRWPAFHAPRYHRPDDVGYDLAHPHCFCDHCPHTIGQFQGRSRECCSPCLLPGSR